ncbi:MAG: methionine--tRNA ligase subunit beta, partial [Bacteroidota bacterium]
GKDNIVFHCIVFPAMLKAHGGYQLPVNVPANQFLNFEGRKFSKSKGWGIEQHQYLEDFADFPNKEDALRYALLRNLPENRDSDFRWDDFVEYHDKELADNLGNFINRVIVLTNKYFGGEVPAVNDWATLPTWGEAQQLTQRLQRELERFSFKAAASTLMELSSLGNTYLQDVSPWKIYKTEPESPAIAECMFLSLQIVGLLSVLTHPFIPFTSVKIRRLLGLPEVQAGDWQRLLEAFAAGSALLGAGGRVGEPELLFAKIYDRKDHRRLDLINAEKEKLARILEEEAAAAGPDYAALKDEINYEDFTKLDIRTGTIVAAEKVKKTDKLLQLRVDLGFEQRTVVSGIAQYYQPEAIIGREVLVLANLAPRKLRGIESQGMILMAEDAEGKLSFVSPQKDWPNGFAVS